MTLDPDLVEVEQIEGILMDLSDHYPPEWHYMRGPGPKWAEKHAVFLGSDALPSMRKPSRLIRSIPLTLRRRLPTGWQILSKDARKER